MYIDLLLDSRHFGGIEAHVLELAKALKKKGHEVAVVFLCDYGPHPLKDKLRSHAIEAKVINGGYLQAIKTLKKRAPNILHTHGYKAGIVGRLASLNSTMQCCSSFHAGEKVTGRLAFYTWLDRVTAKMCDSIIAVSDDIAAELPKRARVLNNFVETKPRMVAGEQIAFVGRLSHEKGADRFIRAAKNFMSLQFHVYGDGPLREIYEAEAPCNVVFHGACNMEEIWPKVGVLVMPSRAEGLPLAALEAMSHGAVVIASKVGGLPKLIQHHKNGWLIDGNEAAIATAINKWLALNDETRALMSCDAQASIARSYSDEAMVPKFIACYLNA